MIAFVAKKAFYKCQYPLTGRFLEFHDGRIRIVPDPLDSNRGHFRIEMRERPTAQGQSLAAGLFYSPISLPPRFYPRVDRRKLPQTLRLFPVKDQ